MIVSEIGVRRCADDRVELHANVRRGYGGEPFELWYRFPAWCEPYLRATGSPFLSALMMPSMAVGEPLEIEAPVHRRLLETSEQLMQIYHSWWPDLALVDVRAPASESRRWSPHKGGSGCFFTLGVDSYYTLLRNLDGKAWHTLPVAHLVFVIGFDVRSHQEELLHDVREGLGAAAAATGTTVLEVETNLREFTDPLVLWGRYHGSALSSVGIALERVLESAYVSASCTYNDLFPWGSHPMTDSLWSTPWIRFIHDGCEATRTAKVAYIADEPVVKRTLRTCWENRDGRYNCGLCEKCLRTMTMLESLGQLESMSTYPNKVPLDALDTLDWTVHRIRRRFEKALAAFPDDPSVAELRECIERNLDANAPTPPG